MLAGRLQFILRGTIARAVRPARPAPIGERRWQHGSSASGALLCGVDCGTQSTKCAVYDAVSGELLSVGAAEHTVESPAAGWAEQAPAQWDAALREALQQALAPLASSAERLRGIGLSFQRESFTLTTPDGAPRARSHCRFLPPFIHFMPYSLTHSIPLFLK